MTGSDAIEQLADWCKRSQGKLLEIGADKPLAFNSLETYGTSEIDQLEQAIDWSLPALYRTLLSQVGRCEVFYGDDAFGLTLYSPAEVRTASQGIWLEEDHVGDDEFCFIGANRGMGDYFGFVTTRSGPANFDVFCHEYPPYEYAAVSDELKSWRTLDQWLVQVVESFGARCL